MRKRASCIVATAVGLALALSGVASADVTLGSTTAPSGAQSDSCFQSSASENEVVAQITDDPSTPYTVPSGGGEITSWSTATALDEVGSSLTLVIVHPDGGSKYTVVGADTETLPTPLPAVATFRPGQPIIVNSGDVLGLYSSDSDALNAPICFWNGGAVPLGDSLNGLPDGSTPAPGQALVTDPGTGPSGFGYMLDVSATVVQRQDVGVRTTSVPSRGAAHLPVLLSSTVTNSGPGSATITFIDKVPAGLTVDSAAAGQGTCSTAGQTITCTISGLAAGTTVPVAVVVTPTRTGNFVTSVSVSSPFPDPIAGNNTATATLAVGASTAGRCVVPQLRNTRASFARTILKDLGCRVKITRQPSRRVRKGKVIKTKPGKGTHPAGTTVRLVVSSGRHKAKHKKHRARAAYLSYGAALWQR